MAGGAGPGSPGCRGGIGLLANRLSLPIVPMRIDGLYELKRSGRKRAGAGEITVTVGEPVRFPPDSDPAMMAEVLQKKVAALKVADQDSEEAR